MKLGRLLTVAVVLGVVMNVVDFLVHGLALQGLYAGMPIMRTDTSVVALVIGDFVAALVFVWVYSRVRGSFAPGLVGGLTFGFYAGVLVSFPNFIFMNLMLIGFGYQLAWVMIFTTVVWCVVAGAVTGALTGNASAPATAAA